MAETSNIIPLRPQRSEQQTPSVLSSRPANAKPPRQAPDCFRDLNLDQITAAITGGRLDFNLEDFIWAGPASLSDVRYRQAVMRDIDTAGIGGFLRKFGQAMADVRERLALVEKLNYQQQKTAWFLTAARLYRDTVVTLLQSLQGADIRSEGLTAIREFLARHTATDQFKTFSDAADHANDALRGVRYIFHVNGGSVSVLRFTSEEDYGAEIAETFRRFRTGDVDRPKYAIPDSVEMDHIEANILEGVRQLYPEVFEEASAFFEGYKDLIDPTIARFDRELQLYLGYLDYISPLKKAGLPFCYPELDEIDTCVSAHATFDLALASKLVGEKKEVITNDFSLARGERIFVVSGPNQGGKTTFARTFGQLHYLASLGLPVPGKDARLLLFDRLFTHFEREENIHNLRGKLQDDLVRIHDILEYATNRSIIVMNEIFTSTTLRDALFLGTRILQQVIDKGALAVCVTFIDELSRLGPETVSLVSTVDPDNPESRTYKIVERRADGLAHAMAIAEKYRLTSSALKERLRS